MSVGSPWEKKVMVGSGAGMNSWRTFRDITYLWRRLAYIMPGQPHW